MNKIELVTSWFESNGYTISKAGFITEDDWTISISNVTDSNSIKITKYINSTIPDLKWHAHVGSKFFDIRDPDIFKKIIEYAENDEGKQEFDEKWKEIINTVAQRSTEFERSMEREFTDGSDYGVEWKSWYRV